MFDLDEMKQVWAQLDRKLDESIRLNRQLLSRENLNGARSELQRLTVLLGMEAAGWFVIVLLLGNFIYQNIGTLRFALPGVAADLYAIGMFGAMLRLIVGAQGIDYDGPIAVIQKELGVLRVLRIRTIQWALLAGTVAWAPFAIVIFKVLFGLESYNLAWLVANLVFGLSLIPPAIWVSKRFSDRMDRSPFIQRLMNDIAGHNLTAAEGFLSELSKFEEN